MDILSNEAFAKFCESKPADEGYDWSDEQNCAVAQYARATRQDVESLPLAWEAIAMNGGLDQTFGALAFRLRNSKADSQEQGR